MNSNNLTITKNDIANLNKLLTSSEEVNNLAEINLKKE